jgi:ligand-binding sensor domain-containing protein
MDNLRNKLKQFSLLIAIIPFLFVSSCVEQQAEKINKTEKQSGDTTIQIQPDTIVNQATVFPQIYSHLHGMVSEFIFQIYEDHKSNFWFCTNHDGIIKYDGKKLIKYTEKDGLGGSAVRCMVADNAGVLWFGTSGGLTKFDGTKFTNYTLGEQANDNEIWSLAIDKEGIIWVGTNNGASKFDGIKFTSFKVPKAKIANSESMISPERIGGILIDFRGCKWFVTDGYGITKFDDKNFEYLNTNIGLTDNNLTSVFEDSKGNIWIGTFNQGVSKYDGLKYTNYTKDGVIRGVEASNFCEDKHGNIWFSVEGLGVYKYDGEKFILYTSKDGLATSAIQHIYNDNKGQIWFCTWQGISLFDGTMFMNVSEKEPWTK